MLILTKYKQAIIKVLSSLTNCLFFIWLQKIFSSKSKKILLYFIAIFGIISLLWQFHFKAVLSDANPPYKNTAHPRKDAFPTPILPSFDATTVLESPLTSETINVDRLGYALTKLYYQNGVDYFRCATNDLTKNDLQYYCDSSINKDDSLKIKDSQCGITPIFCTEEQVFNFQAIKRESFYKRSPGEKIIRLVKEYKSGDTILTDYRISYLPPYDQFNLVPTDSTGVLNVSSVGNPAIKIDSGSTSSPYTNYNGKASNLPACKAGASLQDIGNTCMLKIKIDDINRIKINAKDFDFAKTDDYCHTKTKEAPVLGENCRLPSCLSISKEYYRRPGINCLADCNDGAEFNGIDNANLRLPGINCLPACETGSKSVSYTSDYQSLDPFLPKDIGVTCFLKHQGYVMPVCNSTPLVNSPNSNSQNISDVKNTIIAASPNVPRKDCLNAADLPLCAFFSYADRAGVASKFGCLGMVMQNTAGGAPSFIDNQYVLGVDTINLSLLPQYDEDPGVTATLKNIPIIDYTPRNCNDATFTIGCGKPYTYSKLAQAASSIASGLYPANVDMIPVQDASYNDALNHDSVNENHANSLRTNPFYNTTRTSTAFSVGKDSSGVTVKYKITETLDPYYNATNKPSCSLLTKQELKFIGTRNCDLNQIWSDSTGGKNSIPDLSSSSSKNFCEGQYFCKVDTRCSMFSDEQLQEAKAFFHCLPAQYSKYEESKVDIKCNVLNDFEILALTKTTKTTSAVELDELKNYITNACFRGNLAFLIHKRIDHNIANSTILANTDNVPDYSKINSSIFDPSVVVGTLPSLASQCKYVDNARVNYMFPTGNPSACGASVTAISSTSGSCLSGKFACYHSSQFSCNLEHYKTACYLLANYKFQNIDSFLNGQTTSISDDKIAPISIGCSGSAPDNKKCVVKYGLDNLGMLNCFSDYANFTNTSTDGKFDADRFATISKCDANPLLLTLFVPNAKKTIVYADTTPLSQRLINDNKVDCPDCYCVSIDGSALSKTKYLISGGSDIDFSLSPDARSDSIVPICGAPNSNCYICYKPNFYAGLFKKSTPSSPYYPVIEHEITRLIGVMQEGASQETTSNMGYYQYEDPFYSWFFFPKPNTSGSDAIQTVRDCGDSKKCYKAFTVDFPNSRGSTDVNSPGFLNYSTNKAEYLDFFQYPPIYYYGNGSYGDDGEKEKYNLVSSEEGLNYGVPNRVGLHSINKISSPSATALRGADTMGVNPYGNYTYTSSFDREWLCGMNRDPGGLPDEDTFAYFAPVLVQGGRFGLQTNNVQGDRRRFAFSDTKWNSVTKKLEYYVNICLRYESAMAVGACGRRECRIDNKPGMMHCGEDQCRKFIVEAPDDGVYSKCHLLAKTAMADIDGKPQSHWFVNNLQESLSSESDPLRIDKFLDDDGLPTDYEKCAKLYSAPTLELGKRLGKGAGAAFLTAATFGLGVGVSAFVATVWDYTNHRVRAFYDKGGYVCAELDFYGMDLNAYNANKNDLKDYSFFELPDGEGKICYGGRVVNNNKECDFVNGGFNTFADLNSGIGGLPGAPDPTVWRAVRKVKFISNISNDPNIEFLGYSVPEVADQSTQYAYRTDTNVHNLFPAKMKAQDGLITMVYNHATRMRTIERIDSSLSETAIFRSHQNDRDTAAEQSPDLTYGLLQMSRGKKNPYYGFNGYSDDNDPTWKWLSTSFPDDYSLCSIFGFIPVPINGLCASISIPYVSTVAQDITKQREDGTGDGSRVATSTLYKTAFQPNNFLKEKVWFKSDCVPVQKRVGFPLLSAVATPDNAPNLFAPEPMVFALKTTSVTNSWKKITEINDMDKLNFSDPEIVLKYGNKYYYIQVPKKHASLTKCNTTNNKIFDNTGDARLKFILKEIPSVANDNDLLDKLNNNQVNSSKNEVSTTSTTKFEDDIPSFKEHHNPNFQDSTDSDSIPNKCGNSSRPYGVVIASNLKQITSAVPAVSNNTMLYAQIVAKKEHQGNQPVLCVYRALMNGDNPAAAEDSDLKIIACFPRQQPLVNNMRLVKTPLSDVNNDFLNHEVSFEYKYSDVSTAYDRIANMFKIITPSVPGNLNNANKYQLKDKLYDLFIAKNTGFIEDGIYFEGIKISSVRHYCTALNLDCIDNEREIQKICNNEDLICNRSMVKTNEDLEKLNRDLNHENYDAFNKNVAKYSIRESLIVKLRVRNFCTTDLLNSCNLINGYTSDDIKKFPAIQTLNPQWNNRTTTLPSDISDSAKNTLGFKNMVCLKKGVENLINQSPQFVVQTKNGLPDNVKGKKATSDNYQICPESLPSISYRFAEIYEYKQGNVLNNIITGGNDLCVGIGGGTINVPKLVDFCEAELYPLKNLKYVNFKENFLRKEDLITQGNVIYKSLIAKNYTPPASSYFYSDENDLGEFGVDKSHNNRNNGKIINSNTRTAHAEVDVSFAGDDGMYGICNGFWKNKDIIDAPRYRCDSATTLVLSRSPSSDTCTRYSCPAIQYGNPISSSLSDGYNNQANKNGLYTFYSGNYVIGLDVMKKRGWASWKSFTKTNDFIEDVEGNVGNKSACVVGFAKDRSSLDVGLFDSNSCAVAQDSNPGTAKMLTAICPNSSVGDGNVYNNVGDLPSTQCNQFGYWRFDWTSEEFLTRYDGGIFSMSSGKTVLDSCQRIECSVTDLESKFFDTTPNPKTPIRLIKQRCRDSLPGSPVVIIAELNTQIPSFVVNKYYYLKTNNLTNCNNATQVHIIKKGTSYDATDGKTYDQIDIASIPSNARDFNTSSTNPVTAWYFKVIQPSLDFAIDTLRFEVTTKNNKNTVEHEKLLKVWSKIAGFQPQSDSRTSIPAMRNKTIEHDKIGGEKISKISANLDDDDYDTEGKCLISLGYRIIATGFNPKLLCNYQGILKIKVPCISTCDAVDNSMADTEIHGYSLWAETENKIKVCGDRCSPVTTKIPFSYIGKSTPQCLTGKKPYPYPPFRSLEGVKFEFMNNPIVSVQARYHSSSTKSKDIYDATACSSALNGCIVEFDKTNITENVFLKESNTEVALYKKDSLGGKEKFASYDILPNVKYKINQESSDYFVTLVQSIKLTDDNRWQEYNINKRKIFKVADCSISANSINCQCGSGSHPACPFDNVFDKISEGEVVEINLASSSSPVSLKFQQNTSYTNNIDIETISTASSHFVLQLKKDLSGNLQWKQLVGSYLGLERLANTTSVSMATCTQLIDSAVGLASSDYNCNLNLNTLADPPVVLRNNQEIKINFPSTVLTGGNPSDNYIINYNSKPVKKYNSQGNLITNFNHQELFGDYILRAVDEPSNGVGIDYYLLINATDFASAPANNNYPLPNRTCRYGIGNVWSLPDSACQNTCPGLTQTVPSSGDVEAIITNNNFDSRIGSAITEHTISTSGLSGLSLGYLSVHNSGVAIQNRDKIAVKVVDITANQATLHVIWPALSHQHDVTLILQKDSNTYKIIQTNPIGTGPLEPSLSALHYERDGVKDSIILYRRCGADGKWQDPISLCPIAGPAKGGHSSLNSILGFVSASNIEPGNEYTPTIASIRSNTSFDFNPGFDTGVLKQKALQNMDSISAVFYRLFKVASGDNIAQIPVIPDYRIIGNSLNQFGVSNNGNGVPLGMNPHNIYAYAMCNYNYSNNSSNPDYYNFYNQDFGSALNNGWGTNAKYQCQSATDNHLNTYKIATSSGTSACTQKCNAGIIHRVGRDTNLQLGGNIDENFTGAATGAGSTTTNYSKIEVSKTYFADNSYSKYNLINTGDHYNFYSGNSGIGGDPDKIRLFEIFGSITPRNCKDMSNSESGRCNLFEKTSQSSTDGLVDVVLESQCNNESGITINPSISINKDDGLGTYGYIGEHPVKVSKYCWGLKKTQSADILLPYASCRSNGQFSLANPFQGKKQDESTRFKFWKDVHGGESISEYIINNGIVREILLQYGDIAMRRGDTCGLDRWRRRCNSSVVLLKNGAVNYDSERRLPEFEYSKIVDEDMCGCWDGVINWSIHYNFGRRYVADKMSPWYDASVTGTSQYYAGWTKDNNYHIAKKIDITGDMFNILCSTIPSDKRPPDNSCVGFKCPSAFCKNNYDSGFVIREMSGDDKHYLALSEGVRSLKIIMWGCPTGYNISYDYHANRCIASSSTFIPSNFYPSSIASVRCSSYSLSSNNMYDPSSPPDSAITLYNGQVKNMACKFGYEAYQISSTVLASPATPKTLSCSVPSGSTSAPPATANFECRAKQCIAADIAAFCTAEKINNCPLTISLTSPTTNLQCISPPGRFANNLICINGKPSYDRDFRIDNLCGQFCTYTSQNAGKDGVTFLTSASGSGELIRYDEKSLFVCKTGFTRQYNSVGPDIIQINCRAGNLVYDDARCISNNYCSLNSAPDINFASTNCNQPGIFCKKVDGATTEILISQNQSVNVSCGGSTVGTKTYNCTSGSSTGGTATTSDTCSPITCTVPSAFSTANIIYTTASGSSPLTSSTTLGYRDSSGGLNCATGYTNSADLGYTCTTSGIATMTGRCYRQCIVDSGVITSNRAYTKRSSSIIYLNHNSVSNANIVCSSGYSGTAGYACNDGTLAFNGCSVNSCTIPSDSHINISANQLSSTESPIGHDTTLYCIQGYTSVYSAGSASLMADCTGASGAVAGGSCIKNCDTLPNSDYATKRGVYNDKATCNDGYGGIISPQNRICQANGAWSGACNINNCDTLANSDYATKIGVYNDRAICKGSSGYGSSTPGYHLVCRANGTWSATCVTNLCNVNRGVIGYNYITTDNPPAVPYGGNRAGDPNTGSGSYLFSSDYIKCADGYSSGQGSDGKSAVYQCNNKNSDGTRINIDPIWCAPENCSFTYSKYVGDQSSPTSTTITINHGTTATADNYNCEYKQQNTEPLSSTNPDAVLLNHKGNMKLSCSFGVVSKNSYCPASTTMTGSESSGQQVLTINDLGSDRTIRSYARYYKGVEYGSGESKDVTYQVGWCQFANRWEVPACYLNTWCRVCAKNEWWGDDPARTFWKKIDWVLLYCPNTKFNGSRHDYGLCDY